jgi:DNA-directed RNA polymerase specialized sigma24 family protein
VSKEGSVTKLLKPLRDGDSLAAHELWKRYFERMTVAARARLLGDDMAVADDEDAALSAFHTFCRRLREGHFERLANRNDLWALLIVLTRRKVTKHVRHSGRQKRGGEMRHIPLERLSGDSLEGQEGSKVEDVRWVSTLRDGMDARCLDLLELLPDESLQHVAVRKLEGHSNREIADELGIALRSIERKLQCIRVIWRQEMSND